MKALRPLLMICTIILIASCSSNKKTTDDKKTMSAEEAKMTMTKMMEDGFMAGTIVSGKEEGDCPFAIMVEADEPYYLDPINLAENYKAEGEKVWFKFRGLKMMNRCDKAAPIEISEIQKREE